METGEAKGTRGELTGARRISRRGFLKIGGAGVAGAALLGVAGCGGGGGGQGGGGGGGGGNTLTVGYDQEPDILNQFIVGGDLLATTDMTKGILESPLEPLPDLTFGPQLADGEPRIVSEDPFVLEYTFREGLTWSDGEPLTSADARFTFEQIMNPDNQIISRQGWELVENFETPDERTVRMTFSEPYAPWRSLLGGSASAILPRHIYEGENFNEALNNEIVGSGPYRLQEWNKGQSLTWVRNENYWGEAPAIETINFRFIPDTNTLVTSLQSGEVQFINPPPDIGLRERLDGFQGVTVNSAAGTTWEHIAFNLEEVDNLKMRQAIAYGINRDQVVNEILPGQVNPLNSVLVPEQQLYYTPAWEQYTNDPDRARQLVQEAITEGAQSEITFSTTADNQLRETLQQVVQQQLEPLGITIRIENTAAQTFFGEWTPQGNFEMGEWAWVADPDPQLTLLFGANQVPPDGQNYYRYRNEEVTRLLLESDRALDDQERADLLKQAQNLMAEDLPLIPMYQRPTIYAYTESLQGPQVNPTLAGAFWNVGEWTLS